MSQYGGEFPHPHHWIPKQSRLVTSLVHQPPKLGGDLRAISEQRVEQSDRLPVVLRPDARSNRARVTTFSHGYADSRRSVLALVPSGC